MHYFRSSFLVTLIGLALAAWIGGWVGVWAAFNLALLETSLSFDNAVVNASVLKHWDEKWRRRFLVWGMLIAVFGMRMLFPLLIVAVIAGMAPMPGPMALWHWLANGSWASHDVLSLAILNPASYSHILQSAHTEVTAFGGTFLLMVFWNFFIDANKDEHWFAPLEQLLSRLGRMQMAALLLTLLVLLVLASLLDPDEGYRFLTAGLWGVVVYTVVNSLGSLMGDDQAAAKTGWSGFIYLELLDASFSFDGVLGAFALTSNIFLIAIGLGIGAMFVRSFTLLLVYKGTLSTFRYLEHGAFWAIGALATVMLLATHMHIHEAVTGGMAAFLIVLAGVHSWLVRPQKKLDRQREDR